MQNTSGPTLMESEIEQIEKDMHADFTAYRSDRSQQERYRELLEAREAGQDAAAQSSLAVERRAIERTMRENPAAYWGDPAVRARYREILAQDAVQEPAQPVAEVGLVPVPSRADVYAEVDAAGNRKAFDAGGGYEAVLRIIRSMADVVALVPSGLQAAFRDGFDALPQGCYAAAAAELLERSPVSIGLIGPEDVSRFSTTPEGAALTREWGSDAGRRLGVLRARYGRLHARMGEADSRQFSTWFNGLPTASAKAVMAALAR